MSPTLKKSLDAKVGNETLAAFKKQLLAEVNGMIAQVTAVKRNQKTKSPQSMSRSGSISRSQAVLNNSQFSQSQLLNATSNLK